MAFMFDSAGDYVGSQRDANLDRAKALGATHISMYVVGTPGGSPCSTPADADAIRAKGLEPVPNWERAADYFRNADQAACQRAGAEMAAAMQAMKFEPGRPGFFSWDYDVLDGDYPAQIQKAEWVKSELGDFAFSCYSELGLIKAFVDAGVIPEGVKGWLCMSEGFGHFYDYDWGRYVAVVQQHNASKQWLNPTQPGTDINTIIDASALIGEIMPTAHEIAQAVWEYPFTNPQAKTSASAEQRLFVEVGGHAYNADHGVVALSAKVDALTTAISHMSAGGGVDIEAIKTQIDNQIKASLAGVSLQVKTA